MGYRIVRMAQELFEQFFTEGTTFPTRDGERLRVVKGLPAGAKLVSVSMDHGFATGDIWLKFSSPIWPDHLPGSAIEIIRIEYEMDHVAELQREGPESAPHIAGD